MPIRHSPHNQPSSRFEVLERQHSRVDEPEGYDAGRRYDWIINHDTGEPVGYRPAAAPERPAERIYERLQPSVAPSTARAVAGGLQAHSVGDLYPLAVVGQSRDWVLQWEVHNLQTGAVLATSKLKPLRTSAELAFHWAELAKSWPAAFFWV